MKYVCMNIETTGLNPDENDIIEFGAVIDDTEHPEILVETLPKCHCYVLPEEENYTGQPIALKMNIGIITKIVTYLKSGSGVPLFEGNLFYKPYQIVSLLKNFLDENNIDKVWAAGKNFSNFDKRFLENLEDWDQIARIMGHRTLDPMPMFILTGDKKPPDLVMCLQRAGRAGQVAHTTIEDCYDTITLIRHGIARNSLNYR